MYYGFCRWGKTGFRPGHDLVLLPWIGKITQYDPVILPWTSNFLIISFVHQLYTFELKLIWSTYFWAIWGRKLCIFTNWSNCLLWFTKFRVTVHLIESVEVGYVRTQFLRSGLSPVWVGYLFTCYTLVRPTYYYYCGVFINNWTHQYITESCLEAAATAHTITLFSPTAGL